MRQGPMAERSGANSDEVSISMHILKVIGILIMITVLAFAWKFWVNASRIEKEIEAESGASGEG